jgi:tetratricopeptide (TPR) repeat protein
LPKTRRTVKTATKATRRPARTDTRKKVAPRKKTAPQVVARKAKRVAPAAAQPVPAPAPEAPAPVRKPGFYEAVAIYERGVQALQRHDFQGAAGFFRTVLERYPEERELLERARLYLRVCERETERRQPAPKTAAERVYAATVALNSGDHTGALEHLQRALSEDPDSDHAHYIMAVALGMRQRAGEAIEHLRQAIALNPENRNLARQDPDLESVRHHPSFRDALETPDAPNRRRPAARRR